MQGAQSKSIWFPLHWNCSWHWNSCCVSQSSCIWPAGSSACNASDRDATVWPWDGMLSNLTSNIGSLGVHISWQQTVNIALGMYPIAAAQASHSRACAANGWHCWYCGWYPIAHSTCSIVFKSLSWCSWSCIHWPPLCTLRFTASSSPCGWVKKSSRSLVRDWVCRQNHRILFWNVMADQWMEIGAFRLFDFIAQYFIILFLEV